MQKNSCTFGSKTTGGSQLPLDWQIICSHGFTMSNTELYQLKDAEAKYRGMFENAVEGIYQSTPDGHFLAVNTALARMYGYERPQELLSQVSDIQGQIYADP